MTNKHVDKVFPGTAFQQPESRGTADAAYGLAPSQVLLPPARFTLRCSESDTRSGKEALKRTVLKFGASPLKHTATSSTARGTKRGRLEFGDALIDQQAKVHEALRATGQIAPGRSTGLLPQLGGKQSIEREMAILRRVGVCNPHYALNPSEPGMLEGLLEISKGLTALAANARSVGTYSSHWKRWVAFCELMGTTEWRDDRDANSGVDADGHHNEIILMCAAYIFAMADMKGRKKAAHGEAQPQSGRNFLTSIRAIHASQTPVIEMVPIKAVSHLYKGMMRRHQKLYGNDSIAPSQARPFTKAIIMQLLDVPEDFRISGTFRVSDDSLLWHSWRVYVALAAQSGFRKSELSVCANDTWDPSHISEASVSWVIQGDHIAWANASQLRSLSEGDYLMVRPPPSKADPFALVWGNRPIFVPFRAHEPINAARMVRDRFLRFPVSPATAAKTPLLMTDLRRPLLGCTVDATLKTLLKRFMSPEEAKQFSPHSFRVYLATALRAAGASDAQIQALCRWQSLASLRLYALMDAPQYGDLLDRAGKAVHDARRAYNYPAIDPQLHAFLDAPTEDELPLSWVELSDGEDWDF